MLETRLAEGEWEVVVRLEPGPPDRGVARRPPPPGVEGAPRLWLSYALAVGSWSAAARCLPSPPPAAASPPAPTLPTPSACCPPRRSAGRGPGQAVQGRGGARLLGLAA